MRKTIYYISFILVGFAILSQSCRDEDTIRWDPDDNEKFFMPYVNFAENSALSFSPQELETGVVTVESDIRIDESEEVSFETDVESLDLMVSYTYGNITVGPVFFASSTTWPAMHTMTVKDLAALFPEDILHVDSVKAGHSFEFYTRINLKGGRVIDGINNTDAFEVYDKEGNSLGTINAITYHQVLKGNTSGNRPTELDVYVNYAESVKGDLEGTYSVVTTEANAADAVGRGTSPVDNWAYDKTITVEHQGGGVYKFSDITGGLYSRWYTVYTTNTAVVGNLIDVGGKLSGENPSVFRGDVVRSSGTVNSDGTLTISWTNAFGDSGTNVYTRVN